MNNLQLKVLNVSFPSSNNFQCPFNFASLHFDRHNRTHLKEVFKPLVPWRVVPTNSYLRTIFFFLGLESLSTSNWRQFFTPKCIRGSQGETLSLSHIIKLQQLIMAKSKYFSRGLEIPKPIIMEQWFHQRWEPLNVCKTHPVLGTPVHHIVTLKKPNNIRFEIVQLEIIIDVCVYMDTQDSDV